MLFLKFYNLFVSRNSRQKIFFKCFYLILVYLANTQSAERYLFMIKQRTKEESNRSNRGKLCDSSNHPSVTVVYVHRQVFLSYRII